MIYALLCIFGLYYLVLLLLISGWQRAVSKDDTPNNASPELISIVVPFRNEKQNLPRLVDALSGQNDTNFEVILVDDHSDDGSLALAETLLQDKAGFRLVRSRGEGKKLALTTGLDVARGGIIAVTDADSVPASEWLSTLRRYFSDPDVKMVFGAVRIMSGKGMWNALQEMEFCSVLGTGVAMHAWKMPVFCNGANMAFNAEAFRHVGGYQDNLQIPSGDDEFLLRKISARYPDSIRFMNETEAVVDTPPQPTAASFLNQRIRWAGKWRFTRSVPSIVAALFMALVQGSYLTLLGLGLFGLHARAVLFLVLGKALLEFILIFNVATYLNVRIRPAQFLLLQAIYPFYVLITGVLATFSTYNWKGRNLRPKGATGSRV